MYGKLASDSTSISVINAADITERVRRVTATDKLYLQITALPSATDPPSGLPVLPSDCEIHDGLMHYRDALYVPYSDEDASLRTDVIRAHHDDAIAGHPGIRIQDFCLLVGKAIVVHLELD